MTILRRLIYALIPLLLYSSCYEDNIACLDPDATNYDILADEACPDCCVFPTFSIDVDRFWGTDVFSTDSLYTDGGGNALRIVRFRVYLSELELLAGDEVLPTPENFIEAGIINGADTTLTEINANVVLLQTTGTGQSTVGRLRTGTAALTRVRGRVGPAEDFPAVYPPAAPGSSPLATQAGLLNFNDGRGYLTASVEYVLPDASPDTLRVDVRGTDFFNVDFPGPLAPLRGVDLTLEMAADYERVFGNVDMSGDATQVGSDVFARLTEWLEVTGVR